VAFLILRLFALFNAGVSLGGSLTPHLESPLAIGVLAGLVLGKQLGVMGAGWLAIRYGRAGTPGGVGCRQLCGVACYAGVAPPGGDSNSVDA
jgi:NhaA family Na+:H+ antiporter